MNVRYARIRPIRVARPPASRQWAKPLVICGSVSLAS